MPRYRFNRWIATADDGARRSVRQLQRLGIAVVACQVEPSANCCFFRLTATPAQVATLDTWLNGVGIGWCKLHPTGAPLPRVDSARVLLWAEVEALVGGVS